MSRHGYLSLETAKLFGLSCLLYGCSNSPNKIRHGHPEAGDIPSLGSVVQSGEHTKVPVAGVVDDETVAHLRQLKLMSENASATWGKPERVYSLEVKDGVDRERYFIVIDSSDKAWLIEKSGLSGRLIRYGPFDIDDSRVSSLLRGAMQASLDDIL